VSHDGSISGIVFLVSVVVVLCIILVIGSVGQDDDKVHANLFIITMDSPFPRSFGCPAENGSTNTARKTLFNRVMVILKM
jgi:hypothetical protein